MRKLVCLLALLVAGVAVADIDPKVDTPENREILKKAEKAYRNYQETGITRYSREMRNNEDLADAIRMAARAADDSHKLVDLRVTFSALADKARRLRSLQNSPEVESFLKEVVAAARIRDLIREE